MKKNFVRVMLFGALTLAVSTTVTSCKDYDDDIKGLQEQVDNIKSTNPVSTEDMKAAIVEATKALEKKVADMKDLVDGKVSTDDLKTKIEALEKKLADGDKSVTNALTEAKNLLQQSIDGKATKETVSALQEDVDKLKEMQTTLDKLISAEKVYQTTGKLDGYANTSFDAFVNQSILNALKNEENSKGAIASYVTNAIQTMVLDNMQAVDNKVTSLFGATVGNLSGFITKIHNDIYAKDGIKDQIAALNVLLSAIDGYVGTGAGQYEDYAAIIEQINTTKNQLTALNFPADKDFETAVKDIIDEVLKSTNGIVKTLEDKLNKEIAALKGMIQSIVYVPESADRTVSLNRFMVQFSSGWNPLVTADEMVVKFRVSPKSAITELIKEDSKYVVTTDKQKLTRSTIVPFEVESITAVEGEGNENLIAVTLKGLSAADNEKGYAIALTVKDKDEATRLNDISSDYFAAVQNTLYIQNVEWKSVNADQSELNNVANATIDYKADGSKLAIKTSTNEAGDQGVKEDQTPEELHLDANLFKLSFELTDAGSTTAADNFVLTTDDDKAILSVKDPKPERLGSQCVVKSKVTITDPASTSTSAVTKVFETSYETVTIKSKDEYTAKDIAKVWNSEEKSYDLADIADIKTKLGLGEAADFTGYTVTMTTPADATDVNLIISQDNSTIQLVVIGGKVYNGKVVATLSSANTSLVITIPSVKIDYPKEEEYTLVNNTPGTWDGKTALLNPNFATDDIDGKITTVTATRSLTELFSNFSAIEKNIVTDLGGDIEFTLKDSPIKGVVVSSTGVITVDKTYEGKKPIVAIVTIKCGEKKLSEKNIPIAIPAEMNGTFAYATVEEGETQGELAVTVTNPGTRATAVDLKNALSWKDAKENDIWPNATADIYKEDPMDANGFSVSYAFKNEDAADNAKFELSNGTLTMKKDVANWTQYSVPMEIVVTATPKSPWGDMSSLAKDITVKVPAWRDIQ